MDGGFLLHTFILQNEPEFVVTKAEVVIELD